MARTRHFPFTQCVSAALVLVATAANAQHLEVTGVPAEDVLNLRTEPRPGAPLAGALAPTVSGIVVERRSNGWSYVKFGSQAGWAASRFLRPVQTFANGRPPSPLYCIGTEPFWSFELDGARTTFRTPEMDAVSSEIQQVESSRNSTIIWLVRPSDGPVSRAVVEARQACSDNMSDRTYSLRISIETRDGRLLSGCCDTER